MWNKVIALMLVLAVFVSVFGLGAQKDFFGVSNDVLNRVSALVGPIYNALDDVIVAESFSADDEIVVYRYWFDNKQVYCDLGFKWSLAGNFAKKVFLHSSDPDVVAVKKWSLWQSAQESIWTHVYVDAHGNELYKWYPWIRFYKLECTYYEYLTEYKNNPSMDGWK